MESTCSRVDARNGEPFAGGARAAPVCQFCLEQTILARPIVISRQQRLFPTHLHQRRAAPVKFFAQFRCKQDRLHGPSQSQIRSCSGLGAARDGLHSSRRAASHGQKPKRHGHSRCTPRTPREAATGGWLPIACRLFLFTWSMMLRSRVLRRIGCADLIRFLARPNRFF